MYNVIVGSILLSFLHALIPNHWLPIVAAGRKEKWSISEVTTVTLIAGVAHVASTILIGIILGYLGQTLASHIQYFSHYIAPVLLILLGIFFIYQHHRHHHFHMNESNKTSSNKTKIILTLILAMFLSPCLEIQPLFLIAGTNGIYLTISIAVIYFFLTVTGMVLWVRLAYEGLIKINWHGLEHNSGIIAGWTIIITGIISFFIS